MCSCRTPSPVPLGQALPPGQHETPWIRITSVPDRLRLAHRCREGREQIYLLAIFSGGPWPSPWNPGDVSCRILAGNRWRTQVRQLRQIGKRTLPKVQTRCRESVVHSAVLVREGMGCQTPPPSGSKGQRSREGLPNKSCVRSESRDTPAPPGRSRGAKLLDFSLYPPAQSPHWPNPSSTQRQGSLLLTR